MWVLPRADCGSLPTAGITGSRNSTTWPTSRWAPSPSRLRMRTSSTSAPGSPTTGRVRRSATGSGAPQMAARRGTIWAWKIRSRLGALWWTRRTPTWSTWRPWGISSALMPSAVCLSRWMAARPGRSPNTSTLIRGFTIAHFVSGAVDGGEMHGGVHGGQPGGVTDMQRDGIVREFLDEVRFPVPLQAGRIEAVEHALQHGERHGGKKLEGGAAETAHRFEDLVGLLHGAGVAPDDGAHFLEVERFGEGRGGRHRQEGEEPVDFLRRLENELAIPLHDVGSLVQFPQHRSGADDAHGMSLKEKGRDHAEIAAAAADGPEEVGVLVGAGDHEGAIGQHHVGG